MRTPSITDMFNRDAKDQLILDLYENIYCLKEVMYYAIKAGDWKVDGACDPSELLDDFVPKGQDI